MTRPRIYGAVLLCIVAALCLAGILWVGRSLDRLSSGEDDPNAANLSTIPEGQLILRGLRLSLIPTTRNTTKTNASSRENTSASPPETHPSLWQVEANEAIYLEDERRLELQHQVHLLLKQHQNHPRSTPPGNIEPGNSTPSPTPPTTQPTAGPTALQVWELHADRGTLWQDEERLTLSGSVRITHRQTTIETDTLHYQHSTGIARLPGTFRMQQGSFIQQGRNLQVDLDDGQFRFEAAQIFQRQAPSSPTTR